jgi:hypothetical protein
VAAVETGRRQAYLRRMLAAADPAFSGVDFKQEEARSAGERAMRRRLQGSG